MYAACSWQSLDVQHWWEFAHLYGNPICIRVIMHVLNKGANSQSSTAQCNLLSRVSTVVVHPSDNLHTCISTSVANMLLRR